MEKNRRKSKLEKNILFDLTESLRNQEVIKSIGKESREGWKVGEGVKETKNEKRKVKGLYIE